MLRSRQVWSRRTAILTLLGVGLVLGTGLRTASPGPERHRQVGQVPNLLIIVADDQSGLCLGAAGDKRGATPHLDALARQGVYFERAFCNSPLCTSSRQSFITGLLPHATGVTRLETRLPEKALTLGRWLSILGYRTAAIGKMHFNGPSRHGFDTRIDVADWHAELRAPSTERWRSSQGLAAVHRPARRLAECAVRGSWPADGMPWNRLSSWTAPSST